MQEQTGKKYIVAELLHHGADNAITTKELLRRSGFATARELQQEIREERAAGALILSKTSEGGGYFLPSEGAQGTAEIEQFIRTLHARAANTFAALKAAKAALAKKTREEG